MKYFQPSAFCAALALLFLSASARCGDEAEIRGGEASQWNKTPVVSLSTKRAEMVLNDLWRFMPAIGPAAEAPSGQWGWIRVPGAWERGAWDSARYDGVVAPGIGGSWEGLKTETPSQSFPVLALKGVDRAWFEREVDIPADWAGKRVSLDFERVATDAKVFVNGQSCGSVNWPGGSVDVSAAIKPGTRNTIRLLVIATGDDKEVLQYMDAHIATKSQAILKHRGIIGDVVLTAGPAGPRIDGLFVKPSVRHKELSVDVDLAGLKSAGPATLVASVVNCQTGGTDKSWALDVALPAPDKSGEAVLSDVKLPWENPALWDYKQPNLYTLKVAIKGAGLDDEFSQRFGFREFGIEGRRFLLNGRPYNFRLHGLDEATPIPEVIANQIDGLLAANVNAAELWPNPDLIRGSANDRALVARVADEKGLPLLVGISEPTGLFDPADPGVPPGQFAEWERVMKAGWKQLRNSPSAVILLVAGNRFAHADDQNPLRIGNRKALDFDPVWMRTKSIPGWKVINAVKALDSTRPVTSHHNANVGDFQTSNNYLNMHPLQEREDWLSVWSKSGDMPFSAVEFDAPFAATMNRGRKGWIGESTTEPWLTEFLATYQGPESYANESVAYRAMIARSFVSGQDYKGVDIPSAATFHPFAAWWMTRTMRAWRSYGLSGGMLHWANAYGWKNRPDSENTQKLQPFQAGQRGAYIPRLMTRFAFGSQSPEVADATETGKALADGYSPTLSWIAGPGEAFTRQDHVFYPGEKITKSAALLNDTSAPLPYSIEWSAEAGGKIIGEGKTSGEVAVGTPLFVPLEFSAPETTAKADGTIHLKTVIGERVQEDRFAFRIVPRPAPMALKSPVRVLDPEGVSTKWLESLGLKISGVAGPDLSLSCGGILVIGRNAIAKTPAADWPGLRSQIEQFVNAGGRVLLMAQDPEWIREMSGLRVARHVGRRFWPVPTQSAHPVLAGLDGEDFRDWRGAGTLVDPTPTMAFDRPVPVVPRFGWHVNNTGSIASAAIEKPHFGRWTPLLEGEFDLAFSPLMESRLGAGLLVWCGLDLEGRSENDPSADILSHRLLSYMSGPLPASVPQSAATYLGGPVGEKLLSSMGVVFTKASSLPIVPGLVVIGEGEGTSSDMALDAFVKNGGRVVLLGASAGKLGFSLANKKLGGASPPPAWPEARGLSSSDLRLRADFESPLLADGANEVAANGLLGRKVAGRGVAIAFPLSPDALPAKDKTYFRFSQWRFTRALSQILANLGATFKSDADFLDFKPQEAGGIPLAGDWKIQDELLLPPAPSPDKPAIDPGRSDKTAGWEAESFDDSKWKTIALPMETEKAAPAYADKDGAFWFRRSFDVPAGFADKTLLLKLGPVDDFDDVWINGTRIGGTPPGTKEAWSLSREYKIRPGMLRAGRNTIVVRGFDQFGGGGFTASAPDAMRLDLARPPVRPSPYVEGFRTDHELGDDYARYYRW